MTTATNTGDVRLAAEGVSVLQARSETTDAGPRLEIVAYTGGLMTVPGWGPVAVALDGLDIAGQVPLLADHDARVAGVVGTTPGWPGWWDTARRESPTASSWSPAS